LITRSPQALHEFTIGRNKQAIPDLGHYVPGKHGTVPGWWIVVALGRRPLLMFGGGRDVLGPIIALVLASTPRRKGQPATP